MAFIVVGGAAGSSMSASVSPTSSSKSGSTATIVTPTVTASGAGGDTPYTYAWTWDVEPVGGEGQIVDPALASTGFRFIGMQPGDYASGRARVTVTDAIGRTATATVDVTCSRN